MVINMHCAFITKQDMVIKDTKMISYTFCDLSSGNNFTVFSLTPVKSYDNLKQLQSGDFDFELSIMKNGIKLKPVKGV